MKRCCLAAALVVAAGGVLGLAAGARGQVYTYIGPPGAGWHTASHWSPNGVPGVDPVGGIAVVPEQRPVWMISGAAPQLESLQCGSQLRIWTGLQLASNSFIVDMDLISVGTGFTVGGLLTLTGDNTMWRSGMITGNVTNGGVLLFGGSGGGSGNPVINGLFKNEGVVTMTSPIFIASGGVIENHSTFGVGRNIHPHTPEGNGVLRNVGGGTLVADGPTTVTIGARLDNHGTLCVDGQSLTLSGRTMELFGTVELVDDGVLTVAPPVFALVEPQIGCTVTGKGDLRLAGGNHRLRDVFTNLDTDSPKGFYIDASSGIVDLGEEGLLTNQGLMTWNSGTLVGLESELSNEASGDLIWQGGVLSVFLFNRGDVFLRNSPVIDLGGVINQENGTLHFTDGGLSSGPSSSGGILNHGTIHKSSLATGTTICNVPLAMEAGGKFDLRGGLLTLNRGSEWTGNTSSQIGAGATLRVGDGQHRMPDGIHGFTDDGTLLVAGALQVNGGRLFCNLGGATGELRVTGAIHGSGNPMPLLNEGRMRMAGGLLSFDEASGGSENEGELFWDSGALGGAFRNMGTVHVGTMQVGLLTGHGLFVNAPTFDVQLRAGSAVYIDTGSTFWNMGTVVKDSAGSASISGQGMLRPQGIVEVRGGALTINAALEGSMPGELRTGTWIVHPGAVLNLPHPVGVIGPNAEVRGNAASCPWMSGVESNEGKLEFNDDCSLSQPFENLGEGKCSILPGAEVTCPLGVQNGDEEDWLSEIEEVAVISFAGEPRLITPLLDNYAKLVPGGHSTPGPFNLTGDLLMRPSERLIVEIGGLLALEEHDQVEVTGSMMLAGTLEFSTINSFMPEIGDEVIVAIAGGRIGGISGTFDAVVQPAGLPADRKFVLEYSPTSVKAKVVSVCYANCDQSTVAPVLNVDDFTCFINAFASAQSLPHAEQVGHYANCDGSTVAPALNVDDFTCFINQYAQGCE